MRYQAGGARLGATKEISRWLGVIVSVEKECGTGVNSPGLLVFKPELQNSAVLRHGLMFSEELVSHSGWKLGILSFEKVMGVSKSRMMINC